MAGGNRDAIRGVSDSHLVAVAPARRRAPASSGVVKIADGALVAVRGADRLQVQPIADRFMRLVATTRGLQLHPATAADAHPAITFEVDSHASVVGEAGYRIVVGARGSPRYRALAGRRVLRGCHPVAVAYAAWLDPWHRG